MDYEKKYKEALERAKEFVAKDTVDALEYVFPELYKSEDERIRKVLINGFNKLDKSAVWYNGITNGQILAWLEKQGEKGIVLRDTFGYEEGKQKGQEEGIMLVLDNPQKYGLEKQEQKQICHNYDPTIDSELNDYCCKFFNALHKENGGELSFARLQHLAMDIYKWCKEHIQGEQKPALIIPKFRLGDEIKTANEESLTITKIDDKGYWSEDLFICDFDEECLWDLVEQKPAEDDDREYACQSPENYTRRELMIYNLGIVNGKKMFEDNIKEDQQKAVWSEEDEKMLVGCVQAMCTPDAYSLNDRINFEYWLKSFKDRVYPQPKQEWSEEDERCRKALLYLLEHYSILTSERESCIVWLKSLRPQNTWKPSDEQMRVLDLAIRCGINRGTTEETTLVSLFNDLKKLK